MINPTDFDPLFEYVPAPRMYGVRRLGSVPEEKYRLTVNIDEEPLTFVPAHVPQSGKTCCGRLRRRPPVMAAGGIGLEPFEVRINTGLLFTLIILAIAIWLIYNSRNTKV